MSLPGAAKYLEDMYNIVINYRTAQQMLEYGRTICTPKDLECTKFFETFLYLKEEGVDTKFCFSCDAGGRMTAVCWAVKSDLKILMTFVSRLIDLLIVRRLRIATDSRYSLSTEEAMKELRWRFIWHRGEWGGFFHIQSRLKSMIPVYSAIMCIDQSFARIYATKKVFDTSYIVFSEWRLNQSQMKNVVAQCSHIGSSSWSEDISTELFNLRRSRTLRFFLERWEQFEVMYFTPLKERIPGWCKYLYIHQPKLLFTCFRTAAIPRQYLSQGFDYTESSNSGYSAYLVSERSHSVAFRYGYACWSEREQRNERERAFVQWQPSACVVAVFVIFSSPYLRQSSTSWFQKTRCIP